jgi:polyhydroxyalkanoate synthesis regulator phasin
MRLRTRTAIAAFAVASVVGGGVAGAVLSGPATAAAQEIGIDDEIATTDGRQTMDDVLGDLVDEGIITQDQADVIGERLRAAHAERGSRGHLGGRHLGAGLEDVADLLGLSVDELTTALRDGASIADIASEQEVDVQDVIDLLVTEAGDRLDAAVADGHLTADEAAERLAEIEARITDMVNGELELMGRHGRGLRGFGDRFDGNVDDAAETGADA